MKLALEVQDVSKVYGDGTKALDQVSLDAVSYTHLTLPTRLMV